MAQASDNSTPEAGEAGVRAITRALREAGAGAGPIPPALLPLVHDELRRLAGARLSRLPAGQTLQPTALVHDVYVRLQQAAGGCFKNRRHFFGAAAVAMRDILVEQARRKGRIKRGGDLKRAELNEARLADEPEGMDISALSEALELLGAKDVRKREIVMLRYFAGLSIEETAETLSISPATVKREWNFARAWLHDALRDGE